MSQQYKKQLNDLNTEIKEKVIEIIGENLSSLGFEFLDDYSEYKESKNEYDKLRFIESNLKDIKFNNSDSNNISIDVIIKTENLYRYAPDETEETKIELILNEIRKLLENEEFYFLGKKIKLTVNDQYNNESLSLEDFFYEVTKKRLEESKDKLKSSNSINIFNSKKAKDKFEELANAQRNNPEEAMLKAQKSLGGSVLSGLIEHIGDLTHRTSEKVYTYSDYEGSLENIIFKIKLGLNSLKSGYGFEKELNENINSNYNYNTNLDHSKEEAIKRFHKKYPTIEDYKRDIDIHLLDYAMEHDKLEVYNHFQYASKMSAVALGLKKYDLAINYLEYLKMIVDDPVLYIEVASDYDENYLVNKKYITLEENIQNDNAFELENLLSSIKIKKIIEEKEKEEMIRSFTTGYCAEFAVSAQKIFGYDIGIYQALYIENEKEYQEELEEGIEPGSSDSYGTNYESCHVFLIVDNKIFDVKGLRCLEEAEMYFSNPRILGKRTLNAGKDLSLIESYTGSFNEEMLERSFNYISNNRQFFIEQLENHEEEKRKILQNKLNSVKIKH